MYLGNNPSAIRSQECIVRACVDLMRTMPLDEVSIKRIMERSDLARQTFYQVFETKDEVLAFHLDRLFKVYLQNRDTKAVANLCDAAKLFFRFFEVNKEFVALLVQNNRTDLLCMKCREYLQSDEWVEYQQDGVRDETEKRFAASFFIAGIVGMLTDWVSGDCCMKAEDMANLVCRITHSEETSKSSYTINPE